MRADAITIATPAPTPMMPLRQALTEAVAALITAGVPSPHADAELLAGHVLGLSRGGVQARALAGAALDDPDVTAFRELVRRRLRREPLQHLTGVAHFRGLALAVGPGVFVPRPETELVAQFAIDALSAVPAGAVGAEQPAGPIAVDLGTGSGAIAIAMATEVPHARVYAVEASPDAFVWAKHNARAHRADNVRMILGDLADPSLLPQLVARADVVVSNPPYIPTGMVPRDPEVRLHDPELALYGGEDGLDAVRGVAATANRLLRPGGALVVEHAEVQGERVRELLTADGWRAAQTHPDLTGRPRATVAVR